MNNNDGKKICPFCNSELVYIRWGFPRLNIPKPERAGNNRVEIGGCLPCGYEFKCFECDRCFTYELKEIKFKNDNTHPREYIRLNEDEIISTLNLRYLDKHIKYNDFMEYLRKANIRMDFDDERCITAKSRLILYTFFVKGEYKENLKEIRCPKCNGKIYAKIIYYKDMARDGLFVEDFESKAEYIPQYRCLHCDKKFGYIDRNVLKGVKNE